MADQAPTPVNPLEQALANILQKTVDAVEAGVNFLSEQLPDVIQQLLVWHAVQSAVWFTISLLLGVVILYYTKKFMFQKDWEDYAPLQMFPIGAALACFLFTLNNLEWLQILVAPKLYLIEYAAELYKGR